MDARNFIYALQMGYAMYLTNVVYSTLSVLWDHLVHTFEEVYQALDSVGLLDEKGALVNVPHT